MYYDSFDQVQHASLHHDITHLHYLLFSFSWSFPIHGQTNGQTNGPTDRRTYNAIERLQPMRNHVSLRFIDIICSPGLTRTLPPLPAAASPGAWGPRQTDSEYPGAFDQFCVDDRTKWILFLLMGPFNEKSWHFLVLMTFIF